MEGGREAQPELVSLVRELAAACEIRETGQTPNIRYVQSCSVPAISERSADRALFNVAKRIGMVEAATVHCFLVSDHDPEVRTIASNQLRLLHEGIFRWERGESLLRPRRASGERLLRCLDRTFSKLRAAPHAGRVAANLALVGAAQGRSQEVWNALKLHPAAEAAAEGYYHLWRFGRLAALPALGHALRSISDPVIRRRAAESLLYEGQYHTVAEGPPLCRLAESLVLDEEVHVASHAAGFLAGHCQAARTNALVMGGAWRQLRAGRMDSEFLRAATALTSTGGSRGCRRPAAAKRASVDAVCERERKLVHLLERVFAHRDLAWDLRREALLMLWRRRPRLGHRLWCRHRGHPWADFHGWDTPTPAGDGGCR